MIMHLKVVPQDRPNSDGHWLAIEIDEMPATRRWVDAADALQPHVPADHFLVAYRAGLDQEILDR